MRTVLVLLEKLVAGGNATMPKEIYSSRHILIDDCAGKSENGDCRRNMMQSKEEQYEERNFPEYWKLRMKEINHLHSDSMHAVSGDCRKSQVAQKDLFGGLHLVDSGLLSGCQLCWRMLKMPGVSDED
jgi:hypothetical protein